MVDQDDRKVWRMPGMMADGQGHVYAIGDWWTIPGDLGTLRYDWNGGNEIYEQLPRGQFFAVANVTIPDPSPADLAITASDAPDPIVVNGSLSYTIQVSNNAATEATGVTVSDLLPANVTYVSATTPSGTCTQVFQHRDLSDPQSGRRCDRDRSPSSSSRRFRQPYPTRPA